MKISAYIRAKVLVPFIVTLLIFIAPAYAEPEYVGSSKCKLCHNTPGEGQQYTVWKQMRHAQAFETLLGERAIAIGKERGLAASPSESMECLQCHVTGYDVNTQTQPLQLKRAKGIQCETCHGPGSAHLDDGKQLRMDKNAGIDLSAHILRPDENTCLACHNKRNPTWDPERYTRASGEKVGFDFKQAAAIIEHKNPKKAK